MCHIWLLVLVLENVNIKKFHIQEVILWRILVRFYFFYLTKTLVKIFVTVVSYIAFNDGINISFFFIVQNVDLNTKDQKHLVDIIATVEK